MFGPKALVIGAGRSGLSAADLLLKHNTHVMLYDDKSSVQHTRHPRLTTYLGGQEPELNRDLWALIISPGVPLSHHLVQKAKALGVCLLGEIDLAFMTKPSAKIIGITGTNGKSTTTTMLEHILREAGKRVRAGGNLGTPMCDLVHEELDYIILELSSFQLELLKLLKLDLAMILNITPDHLDRYNSMSEYVTAKLNIINLIDSNGYLITKSELSSAVNYFSSKYIYLENNNYLFLDNLAINGEHNKENARAAACAALTLGIGEEAIYKALMSYKPLPHRCEFVGQHKGISFINDSKGTTVEAVKRALSMTEKPVHLLLGGVHKGEDFGVLRSFSHIKNFYIYGQAQDKIMSDLKSPLAHNFSGLEQAFRAALASATAGDTILLSPGCASYDQFKDYTERGQLFRELVANL